MLEHARACLSMLEHARAGALSAFSCALPSLPRLWSDLVGGSRPRSVGSDEKSTRILSTEPPPPRGRRQILKCHEVLRPAVHLQIPSHVCLKPVGTLDGNIMFANMHHPAANSSSKIARCQASRMNFAFFPTRTGTKLCFEAAAPLVRDCTEADISLRRLYKGAPPADLSSSSPTQ